MRYHRLKNALCVYGISPISYLKICRSTHNISRQALHSLSLDHYRVFIQNQECVRHVRIQGQQMDEHLSALLAEVHGLGSEFSVFQREAAELVGGHKRNRQTLKHHMQVCAPSVESFLVCIFYMG